MDLRDTDSVPADGRLVAVEPGGPAPCWIDRGYALARRRLPFVQFALDALAWAIAIPVATLARYDFETGPVNGPASRGPSLVAVALQGVIGLLLGLYRRYYHYGSFEEVRALGLQRARRRRC